MTTAFTKLNEGWNAEPNGHKPHILIEGTDLVFEFLLNDLQYPEYKKADKGIIRFRDCWRYRLGRTNDEGWYRGQCRFSRLAPKWGEFYEVHGDLLLDKLPLDWVTVGKEVCSSRHFLFYLRDQTFECDASAWEFSVKWHG
jgi:hypothetical protein